MMECPMCRRTACQLRTVSRYHFLSGALFSIMDSTMYCNPCAEKIDKQEAKRLAAITPNHLKEA